jgi:hypothetical protein
MLIITNLDVRCKTINIFNNSFCKHGGEVVALVWTWPSSWTTCIGKCSSNTTKWPFDYEDLLWEGVIWHTGIQECYFVNLWAWMWTCEHEPMNKMEFFYHIWWHGWNMLRIFFTTLDKTFTDVEKYFYM